jgi:hypothetical protein
MRSVHWLLVGAFVVAVGGCSSSATPAGSEVAAGQTSAMESAMASGALSSVASASGEPASSPAADGAQDAYPFLSGYTGHFAGKWTNKTFGSTGSMTWDITADSTARTVEIDVTIGGPVFGGPGVKPEKIKLTHLAQGVIQGTSPDFGDISGTITPDGTLTITLTNVPGGAIAKVTISGKLSGGDTISIDYTVEFVGGSGSAAGTVTLEKA